MWIVIAYDIADDRRRSKVVKVLEGICERVQESVFECEAEWQRVDRLIGELQSCIAGAEDSIRVYGIPSGGAARMRILGQGRDVRASWDYIGDEGGEG